MKSKNQNPRNDGQPFSRDEVRTIVLFWVFWSINALLSALLVIALFTDWPEFLHEYEQLGR